MTFDKPERHVGVFLHCSASDNPDHDDIGTIRSRHVDGNGWSDVGYHYFIRSDGTLEAGRPLERTPAAQAGHNGATIDLPAAGEFHRRACTGRIDLARAIDRPARASRVGHHCSPLDQGRP